MKKKDYVPPKAIVISLQFEGHILAGTNNSLQIVQIGFSSDESLGATSEQNIFGRKQEPVHGGKESTWD